MTMEITNSGIEFPDATKQSSAPPVPIFTKSWVSAELTITQAGFLDLPHTLGVEPKLIYAKLICKVANLNYPVGATRYIRLGVDETANSRGVEVWAVDSSNLKVRFGNSANTLIVLDATSGAASGITNTSWKLILEAYA